jgi:hypothetical protein
MPLVDRQQGKVPLPQSSQGLLLNAQPSRPDAMPMQAPTQPQGGQVPNWMQNALSAADQGLMTSGMLPGGLMQGQPPQQPDARIMVPLMMLAMAAEPGPDVLGPLLKRAHPRLVEPLMGILKRGTPKIMQQLNEPLPISKGRYLMLAESFAPAGEMPFSVQHLAKEADDVSGGFGLGLDDANDNMLAMRNDLSGVNDPDNWMGMQHVADRNRADPRFAKVNAGKFPDMSFKILDPQSGGEEINIINSHMEILENMPLYDDMGHRLPPTPGSQDKVQLTIDIAGRSMPSGEVDEFGTPVFGKGLWSYNPDSQSSNRLGREGLRDVVGHILSIYRKNFGIEPDVVGGFRVKTDAPMEYPAAEVRQSFEAAWKALFGAAAAMPAIEFITGDTNEQGSIEAQRQR